LALFEVLFAFLPSPSVGVFFVFNVSFSLVDFTLLKAMLSFFPSHQQGSSHSMASSQRGSLSTLGDFSFVALLSSTVGFFLVNAPFSFLSRLTEAALTHSEFVTIGLVPSDGGLMLFVLICLGVLSESGLCYRGSDPSYG
jgi:hypothetical protein